MRKDDIIKRQIKHRNKDIRQRVCKLTYVWYTGAILLIAVVLLIISYFIYQCHPWLSGVFVSTSCGCFTGITFYFLVNIRMNKERRLQKEYTAIKKTLDLLQNVLNIIKYHQLYQQIWQKNDTEEILSYLYQIEDARNLIDISVYNLVDKYGYDPLDMDNMNSYREKILESKEDDEAMRESIVWIGEELSKAKEELQELLREREDQISFIGNYFL